MVRLAIVTLFDEPYSGLDSKAMRSLHANIKSMMKEGDGTESSGAVGIMTVHTITPQVFELLDVLMVLHRGRLVYFGPASDLNQYCDVALRSPTPIGWATSDHILEVINLLEQQEEGAAASRFEAWKSSRSDHSDDTISNEHKLLLPASANTVFGQLAVLLWRELQQELPYLVNRYQVGQNMAISLIVGWLFLGAGSGTGQRDLREVVGLFFYTTTLWTFTPLYAAIVRMRHRMQLAEVEMMKGMYHVGPFVVAVSVTDLLMHSIWPAITAMIMFMMARVGGDPGSFISLLLLVVLCALVYQSVGTLVSVIVPNAGTAMAISTALAQTTLVAGGFYRTMPESIKWMGHFSLTTYAFRGLLRATLSWKDTFSCHPRIANANAGRGSCFIEESGIIDDLDRRGIVVVDSPEDPSHLEDMLILFLVVLTSRVLVYCVLKWKLKLSHTRWEDSRGSPLGDMAEPHGFRV